MSAICRGQGICPAGLGDEQHHEQTNEQRVARDEQPDLASVTGNEAGVPVGKEHVREQHRGPEQHRRNPASGEHDERGNPEQELRREHLARACSNRNRLIALAVFRHVPHVPLGWHRMGLTLDSVREYSWSRRVLEYLPLAGFAGLARRSAPAAAFFGMVLLATVIFPLGRVLDLTGYLLVIVPGLPVYWLLAASIPYLVPRRRAATSPAASTAASVR